MKLIEARPAAAAPKTAAPAQAPHAPVPPPSARTGSVPWTSSAPRANDGFTAKKADPHHWWKGRPLSEGRNAHKTNTVEQFKAAMNSDSNWFEADLRQSQNPPHAMECRHDKGDERGDNLTLKEWLKLGTASGRGLKLDIKEPQHMPEILKDITEAGLPSDRLMINLGDTAMAKWGPEVRKRFPDATMAINPRGEMVGGKISDAQVDRMIELAKKLGSPATFVVRYDLLTDASIKKLSATGPVSVWNDPNLPGAEKPQKVAEDLRKRGVGGVIDVRASMGQIAKAEQKIDTGAGLVRAKLKSIF